MERLVNLDEKRAQEKKKQVATFFNPFEENIIYGKSRIKKMQPIRSARVLT